MKPSRKKTATKLQKGPKMVPTRTKKGGKKKPQSIYIKAGYYI